jgi:hypothetical protein
MAADSKHQEYVRYAMHCLEVVRIAADRKTRILQREMAAEWFKLADMFSATEQPAGIMPAPAARPAPFDCLTPAEPSA